MSKISVIVPTYNEHRNILPLIDAIHVELREHDHEILVVDDNSPDGTFRVVEEQRLPYVRALLRTEDRGFAKSIRCGLENARGDVLVVMDSDFNHQPKYIPFMVENLRFYDCVSASRFLYGGAMDSRVRHWLSWAFNVMTRILTGKWVTDSLYGFFAIKRGVIEKLDYDLIFWGYGDYFIRLLYYLQERGTTILQFPAINGKRLAGVGNQRFLKTFLQYFNATLSLVWRERIR